MLRGDRGFDEPDHHFCHRSGILRFCQVTVVPVPDGLPEMPHPGSKDGQSEVVGHGLDAGRGGCRIKQYNGITGLKVAVHLLIGHKFRDGHHPLLKTILPDQVQGPVIAFIVLFAQKQRCCHPEQGAFEPGGEVLLIKGIPEKLPHHQQGDVLPLSGHPVKRFDHMMKSLVFPNESEKEKHGPAQPH